MSFMDIYHNYSHHFVFQMYDTPEHDLKLNDVFEFIAIYTFDPELVSYKEEADDLMDDLLDDPLMHLPPSKVVFFSSQIPC